MNVVPWCPRQWSPGWSEAVSAKTHGIIRGTVENGEPATPCYEYFGQSCCTIDGVDDRRALARPWNVLEAGRLIECNSVVEPTKRGRGRWPGVEHLTLFEFFVPPRGVVITSLKEQEAAGFGGENSPLSLAQVPFRMVPPCLGIF